MTSHQKNLLVKLVLGNLVLYVVLAFFVFGPPLPQMSDLIALLPTAIPTRTRVPPTPMLTPTVLPTPTATIAPKPTARVVRAIAPTVVPQAAPVMVASGANPSDPMSPADAWRTIGAGAQVWYKIGDGGVHMDVALQAKPLEGLSFEVFAPHQMEQPIGRGTFQNQTASLVWAGGHWQASGAWLARITNSNPTSAQYKLTSAVKDISNKTCHSYWEPLGGNMVYWTICE